MKYKITSRAVATAIIVFMSSFTFTYCQTNNNKNEFWKQLGITEKDLKISISRSFFQPVTPDYWSLKKISSGNRAALVIAAGNYAKQYVATPAFEKEYKQLRDAQMKANTPAPALTWEQIAKKKITETGGVIKTYENALKTTADANAKKEFTNALEISKKQLAEYKSGKSAQIEYELRMDAQRYADAKKLFDEWVKEHHEQVQDLIKLRLNEFIAVTKGIDYNAVYVEGLTGGETGGEGHFKNPVYGKKSIQWKHGFWAGKEITETARTFALQWLKELN